MGKRDDHHARTSGVNTWRAGCGDKSHVPFSGRAGETHRSKDGRALRSDPYLREDGVVLTIMSTLSEGAIRTNRPFWW